MREQIFKNKELVWSFLATFVLGMMAHGYCYLNDIFSHDSMLIFQNDNDAKHGMGRFLTGIYREIRGPFTAPWLIGIFSLVWLSFAVYLLIKLFDMKQIIYIVITAALLATNYSLTLLNATYIHDADCYMLSVLLAVAGAYLTIRYFYGFIPGGICLAASMAFYQANLPIAFMILLLWFIKKTLGNENWKRIFAYCGQALGAGVTAFLAYKIGIWWFVLRRGISIEGGYNSISGVGDFAGVNIGTLCLETIKYVYDFFVTINAYNITRVRNATFILVLCAIGILVVLLVKGKVSVWNKIASVVAVLAIPLVINSVYFISKGMSGMFHHLMIYPFCMLHFSVLFFMNDFRNCDNLIKKDELRTLGKWLERGAVLLFIIIILNNVTMANDIYLKKSLESKATLSLMTRVVDRMEETEGYVPGETEVVIVGEVINSTLNRSREGFDRYNVFTGQAVPYSVTYYKTYAQYFHYILGYPVKMVDEGLRNEYMGREEVKEMPVFPAMGSTKMLDGKLIVKMGNCG